MIDNVFVNKSAMIERCLQRIAEEYQDDFSRLENSYTVQDSVILNLQRACEAAIDLAMHLISQDKLGVPQSSRDGFRILEQHKLISQPLSEELQKMVGFRNVAVHDYQAMHLPIVKAILETKLSVFEQLLTELKEKR